MINMFSFSFILILFIVFDVNGQINSYNTYSSNNFEKSSSFGQYYPSVDNQNRDFSSSSQSDIPPVTSDQSTLLSCFRIRPNIKNAHPTDNTKYYVCRDEYRYEIFTCPNGGIFDNNQKACIDLCEQKKPCLNQGQCIILSNLTLQCVCRRDWTGERCEIPVSTCANNPCGLNAECHMLKSVDYSQDYVCICDNQKSYGRNCQQTVPNPCLSNRQQFHPFAYSLHAYINCDGERIFFQPCNSLLYWNQEEKRCDRLLPDIFKMPFMYLKKPNEQKYQVQSNTPKSMQWQNDNTMQQPLTNQYGQNQQWKQNNLPTVSQDINTQQWSNQIPNNQYYSSQSQPWQSQSQQLLTNTYIETTTAIPKTFHSQGFSTYQSGEQQNNGYNQWAPTSIETSTPANKGIFMNALRGWQTNQQESLNQNDQQKIQNSIPTYQTRSWKTSS